MNLFGQGRLHPQSPFSKQPLRHVAPVPVPLAPRPQLARTRIGALVQADAHETLFRIGIAGNLVYAAGLTVLLAALYVILRGVSPGLALLATLWKPVFVGTWALFALNCFTALRLLSGSDYARAYGGEGAQVPARLYLGGYDLYYVGLLFWALSSTVYACLWLESRWIPRALAVFGIAGSVWCAACTLLLCVFPGFPKIVNLWWFDVPMVLFELSLGYCCWLGDWPSRVR